MPARKHLLLSCWAEPQDAITAGQPSFLTVLTFPICTAVWHGVALPLMQDLRLTLRICSVHPDLRPCGATLLLQSTAQMPVWMPLSTFQADSSAAASQSGASGKGALIALA